MVSKLVLKTLKLFNVYPKGCPQISCQNGFSAIDQILDV